MKRCEGDWVASRLILVGIGANLPAADGKPPLATCRAAAAALDALPGLRLIALSRWYATAPQPPAAQPDYVNAVARLAGAAAPARLLSALQAVEAAAGRRRGAPNAARTLDLDLLAIGGLVRASPDPILPHPRTHLRAFVLAPLAEVAPGWRHPLVGLDAAAMLAALASPPQPLRALAGDELRTPVNARISCIPLPPPLNRRFTRATSIKDERMARVTVEDCVQKVPNRFELVLLAAQRARNLSRGEELTVDRDDDKNPVVALREIADETIDLGRIEGDLIKSLSRAPEPEPADEEVLDLIPTDQNIFGLQDVSAEEEASALPVENEEISPEDLEAAIEAELGGRPRR